MNVAGWGPLLRCVGIPVGLNIVGWCPFLRSAFRCRSAARGATAIGGESRSRTRTAIGRLLYRQRISPVNVSPCHTFLLVPDRPGGRSCKNARLPLWHPPRAPAFKRRELGADGESRPHNLLLTRQALRHLSYTSKVKRGRRQISGAQRGLLALLSETLPRHSHNPHC